MLAGRAGEIVSRRETLSQCGRVGSPVFRIICFIHKFTRAGPQAGITTQRHRIACEILILWLQTCYLLHLCFLRGHTRENHVVSQNQGRRGSANMNHTGSVHPLA